MNEQQTEIKPLVNFIIDGTQVSAPKGTTVYAAARKLGIDIPIFCYQDRMPPFGACRVCLVEVEKMAKPQTSCTLEATEGMVVHTNSEMSRKGREQILEFLLINHPLDCPTCDKGGECPLQDQTVKFGPARSRFYEEKRHFEKPIPLSPVLVLDRERCIVCARCTRFGDLVAGDHALELKDRGFKTEVAVPKGGTADSKFIGNTIAICPVGALTSRVYRFKARPWDNKSTETTCTLCPVGCSMILDTRDGEVMRTRAKENKAVNDMWLCDKGWFGYEFSRHENRLNKPLIRKAGQLVEASWDEALSLIASKIKEAKPKGKLAGLGGNPLTTEENYLFQKLIRDVCGTNHVDHRVGIPVHSLEQEGQLAGMEIPIQECEELSYVLLLGIDLTEDFPLLWLRLKQAINRGAKAIFIGHYAPEIASHLDEVILHAPGEEPKVLRQNLARLDEPLRPILEASKKVAVFVGRQYLAAGNRLSILSEIHSFLSTKPTISLNILHGRGNSMGARLAGMRPDLGIFGEVLRKPGLNSVQIIVEAAENGWDYLHIAGADPATCYRNKLWNEARKKLGFLVVQDLFLTETARQADVVLPTLCFMEKEGHFINIEGRSLKIRPGKEIPKDILSDASIFKAIANKLEAPLELEPNFVTRLNDGYFQPVRMLHSRHSSGNHTNSSEGLRATFSYALFDEGVRMKHNEHLVKLVKEPCLRIHPAEGLKRSIKTGDLVNVSAKGFGLMILAKLDETVALQTAVLPLGFPAFPVHNLANNLFNGLEVEIKNINNEELVFAAPDTVV